MPPFADLGPLAQVRALSAILDPLRDVPHPAPGKPPGPQGDWGYVLTKAFRYRDVGPEAYGRTDALRRPPATWDEETVAAVTNGIEQLLAGRGLVASAPLQGLTVPDVHALMHVLHFGLESAHTTQGSDRRFLDEMRFRHEVSPGLSVVVWGAFVPEVEAG